MHTHTTTCIHELKVCTHCDAVYCTRCQREWGAACTLPHYQYWYPTYVPNWGTYTVTCDTTASQSSITTGSVPDHRHS